jgi:hypothetical protein
MGTQLTSKYLVLKDAQIHLVLLIKKLSKGEYRYVAARKKWSERRDFLQNC